MTWMTTARARRGGWFRYGGLPGKVKPAARLGTVLALALLLATTAAAAAPLRLLVLGDSLAAGYGLPQTDGFVAQLQRALAAEGLDVEVVNGGVSGDTTAGGLARLSWLLGARAEDQPDAAIVELGANDALRGLDPEAAFANLDAILSQLKERGIPVLLAGMRAPPNMGRDYEGEFNAIYPRLAASHDVPLYTFFLEGVAAEHALNQADRIHPNADGVAVIVERILPAVKDLLITAERK
ncbi:MAG: arylesterase [Rhodospirillales bacterium]|nr:arylesterase [Rhodospirillales bacterium]